MSAVEARSADWSADEVSALDGGGWVIRSDHEADWALRKLGHAQHEFRRIVERFDEEMDALQQRRKQALAKPERDAEFFEGHLVRWHQQQRPNGARYPLAYGALTSRRTPAGIDVVDNTAFRDWAEGNQRLDLLRITVEPDRQALLAWVKETGEVPPGVEMREPERRWKAEPAAGEQPTWLPMPDEEEP